MTADQCSTNAGSRASIADAARSRRSGVHHDAASWMKPAGSPPRDAPSAAVSARRCRSLPYALLLRQYPRPTFTREPFYLPVGHPQRCGNHDVALRRFDAQIHVLDGFARYVQHQTVNNQHLGSRRSASGRGTV